MAPTIAGSGIVLVGGGLSAPGNAHASSGLVRLEAFQQNLSVNQIQCTSASACVLLSTPNAIALPTSGPGALIVTSINGTAINANPFSFPDTTINTMSPVTVSVQALNIPTGTVPTLTIFSETGPDQVLPCSALSGTLQQSTCTVSVPLPTGGSRGFVKATWAQ
jgi:hypothetical protein